jgi:hypothetical protein
VARGGFQFRANLGFCPVGPPLVSVPLAPEQLDLACRQAAAPQMQETEMRPRSHDGVEALVPTMTSQDGRISTRLRQGSAKRSFEVVVGGFWLLASRWALKRHPRVEPQSRTASCSAEL